MDKEILLSELKFKAVRSSGAGGQNVNKVSSKVVLNFDLANSSGLTNEEKELLQAKIATKLTQENILILTSEEDRSQLKNKEIVVKKFLKVIQNGLKIPKERKETKIPKAVKEKRLQEKKSTASIKENRKKPDF
ncbi:MAG TPA: alternative ribosome rescue aminoacyl-tRNA hydrolase ArfB [Flavobacterium sp.]|uniref:alternative ribosome rescue aminoacyl-tRNA hydrolase ArfB n=1 Tax=Flavobacterium sp. TaxID=239 RepID=UPI002B4B82BD|nr:alternative ribosome rescue aminoacyl-tRNA hydrolase ArfB [Flavobacterium sp.]HLO74094.1 alternative ribosome rescue aminoacyl-tRNA hydrolase ArfB [Flavobacterium sp.]